MEIQNLTKEESLLLNMAKKYGIYDKKDFMEHAKRNEFNENHAEALYKNFMQKEEPEEITDEDIKRWTQDKPITKEEPKYDKEYKENVENKPFGDGLNHFTKQMKTKEIKWNTTGYGNNRIRLLSKPKRIDTYEIKGKIREHVIFDGILYSNGTDNTENKILDIPHEIGLPKTAVKSLNAFLNSDLIRGTTAIDEPLIMNKNSRKYTWEKL